MTITEIITAIVYVLLLVLTLLNTFLAKYNGKKIKAEGLAEGTTTDVDEVVDESFNDNFEKIVEIITTILPNTMIDAQKQGMTGKARKTFVMSAIMMEFMKLGLNFNEYATIIESALEHIVAFGKSKLGEKVSTGEETEYYGVK